MPRLHHSMRQWQRQPAARPSSRRSAQPDKIAQLKELGELKAAGVLTEEEFQAEKAKILNG